ncbi:MAG TPA: YjgN family protein [Candidatus Acidoferrum sp.]|nr:YjgN family protein [Candidatus Acidoferrum sp.]
MDRPINDTNNNNSRQALEFTGSGTEYFGIWIVNLALTIVTLGIFSAWAKVRRLRYFYGHTRLDGHGFEYLGDPKRILIGRLIAVSLLAIYSAVTRYLPAYAFPLVCVLAVLIPFILVSSIAFTLRNTAYRHIRFRFRTSYAAAYKVVWLPILLSLLLAGFVYSALPQQLASNQGAMVDKANLLPQILLLCFIPMIPWLDYLRARFVIDHSQYGSLRCNFTAGAGSFYGLYGLMLVITLGAMLLLLMILGVIFSAIFVGKPPTNPAALGKMVLVIVIPVYLVMFLLSGWFTSRRNTLLRNSAMFGKQALSGDFKGGAMAWILFTNLLGMVFTLGLFYPWAAVRQARYNAVHTWIPTEELASVTAEHDVDRSAVGEEIGDFFDIDIGL